MNTSDSDVSPGDNKPKASDIASTLSDKSVHSTLMKLFKPKMDTTGFNPPAIASKVSHGQKKSLKLACKRDTPQTKGLLYYYPLKRILCQKMKTECVVAVFLMTILSLW